MDRSSTPPPPPGTPRHAQVEAVDGVLEFIIDLPPLAPDRSMPPPPPGAATRAAPPLAIGRNEPLGPGIRRIGTGLLDRAAAALTSEDRSIEEALRPLEQSRALLRLVRPIAGERAFLFEDRRLREVVGALAPWRDDIALSSALGGIIERFGDRLVNGEFGGLRAFLESSHRRVSDAQIANALEVLTGARSRYATFSTDGVDDTFASLEPGLRATFAKGQLRMGEVYRHHSDRTFQKWRVQVGYLRDQTTILDPDWATLGISERLRKLAGGLSEARHLTLLQNAIGAQGRIDDDVELLRVLALGRCQDLYRSMLDVGSKIYEPDPEDFTRSFGEYWRSWRSH